MDDGTIQTIGAGLSQRGVRNHNERLVLSLLLRHGALPGSDLSRLAGLSAPTVSTILRSLVADGLLEKGDPVRGKVGKPSIPMRLSADGVLSFGLKIGRRSADLLLIDFTGVVRQQMKITYPAPRPTEIFQFLRDGMSTIISDIDQDLAGRICGLGISAPFELWNWTDLGEGDVSSFDAWRHIDVAAEVRAFFDGPVAIMNDATAACQAEHVYGRGKSFRDYAYFFVASFVGGGIVLNHSVFQGRQNNAGALGSLRTVGPHGESRQLVDTASLHLLEKRLREVDIDPAIIWTSPNDWSAIERHVDMWLGQTAQELARACLSTCSVIDFEAVIIDGNVPPEVRTELVERVRRYIVNQDTRGLITPQIESGTIGGNARALGAASQPIFARYFLNTHAEVMQN